MTPAGGNTERVIYSGGGGGGIWSHIVRVLWHVQIEDTLSIPRMSIHDSTYLHHTIHTSCTLCDSPINKISVTSNLTGTSGARHIKTSGDTRPIRSVTRPIRQVQARDPESLPLTGQHAQHTTHVMEGILYAPLQLPRSPLTRWNEKWDIDIRRHCLNEDMKHTHHKCEHQGLGN